MTKLMKNLYDLGSKTIRLSIISIRHHAENGMMRNSLCRLVAVLLLSVGTFSYAQADTTTHDDVTPGVTYDVWDGSYDLNLNSLARTADGYYRIRSAKDLATMFYYLAGNHRTDNFRLEVDVDMSKSDFSMFNTTKHFKGTFDGGGHYIYGVSSSARSNYDTASYGGRYGFFRSLGENSAATIKNFTLVKPYLSILSSGTNSNDNHYYGIIAGKVCSPSVVENINVINPIIYVRASLQKTCYISTGVAMAQANAQIRNIKVTDPKIYFYETATLTNNPVYVGGAVGYAETNTAPIENILVANPVVATAGTHSISKGQKFAFGGVVGFLSSNGSGKSYANASYLKNCAVQGGSIDFTGFQPATTTNLRNNQFAVGGVIGIHDNPFRYSENLFFSGNITAPYAYVAPCMALEYISNTYDVIVNNYSGIVNSGTARIDQVERSKSATWYYRNFKIGLSGDLTSHISYTRNTNLAVGTKSPNFDSGDIEVIDGKNFIDVSNLKRYNRRNATPRPSKTVLWWTQNSATTAENVATQVPADGDAFNDWTQGVQDAWPETNRDLNTYPTYFMYYAQGVNLGTQEMATDAAATKFVAGIEKNIEVAQGNATKQVTLSISNVSSEKRGFGEQTFEVVKDGDNKTDVASYQWFVGGAEKTGTTYTNTAKASFVKGRGWQTGQGISVVALDGSGNVLAQANTYIPLGRFRIKDYSSSSDVTPSGDYRSYASNAGTKNHPFLIGTEEDLRLLSELSRQQQQMPIEYVYLNGSKYGFRSKNVSNDATKPCYNMAYYEMDDDVTLSNDEFYPIGGGVSPIYSGHGDDGYYSNMTGFMGVFDGKGHTISNMHQTFKSGVINDNARAAGFGLFTAIGGLTQYYKVGETTLSNAAVRNLNLEDFQITAASDLHLKYPGSNKGNRLFIGTLAGVVGTFATVENISVVNSSISDAGASSTYYIPQDSRYAVGGVYGRGQASLYDDYNGASSMATTSVNNIAANTDIDISKAAFTNSSSAADQLRFGVGGIVGSIYSKGDQSSMAYPRPAFFGGKIKTPNAFAGPIFAIAENLDNRGTGWADMPKHFLGKTERTGSVETYTTDMYYANYRVDDGGVEKVMNTTNYPKTTNWGDRNIKQVTTHSEANVLADSDQYEYQGVNQGNAVALGDANISALFDECKNSPDPSLFGDLKWGWESSTLKLGGVGGDLYISARDTYDGDNVTTHKLEVEVNTTLEGEVHYQWFWVKNEGGVDTEVNIPGANSATYTATQTLHNQYIKVRVWIGDDTEGAKVSDFIIVPKSQEFSASIGKTGASPNWTMTTALDPASLTLDGSFDVDYQWYMGRTGYGTELSGETSSTLNVDDKETTMRYCVITVTDEEAPSAYVSDNTYTFTVSKLPADVMVVFLDPSGSGDDDRDGLSPATAVKSWHKAYSLLSDGGTWDDNIVVLMSESDGDRTIEGFRLDKSLEAQYTEGSYEGWYSRTHDGIDAFWPNTDTPSADYTTGMSNSHLWKNATITGKWGNHDYSSTAKITFKSDRAFIGLNGDTKFKNLTFRGHADDKVGSSYDIFFCQYHNVEFGDSLKMEYVYADGQYGHMAGSNTPDFEVFGGFNGDARFRHDTNGFLGNEWDKYFPHGKEGFTMTFKSGHFGVVCASHRQAYWTAQGMSGTPNMPVKCKIVVDMDRTWNDANRTCIVKQNNMGVNDTNADYDIGLILAGNHEGAMYGDVDINVYSGSVARIANGTLGAYRKWYGYAGICQPGNAYFGRANTLLDPSLSRFATPGETSAEKNKRIIITEIYGGGLGRDLGDNGMIFIPFYGKSSVTMNGGTFKLLPEGNKYDAEGEVFPGIFATGAGGVNGMYHYDDPIAIDPDHADNPQVYPSSQRLPYWDTDKGNGVVWGGDGTTGGLVRYGNWTTYNTHNSATDPQKVYVHCYNADTDDFTDLDPEDSQATVTINDGVFGSKDKPIDGIYGGGSGYTPTYILKNGTNSYPNYRSGNIYGKEGADHPVATLTINGGEFYCKNGIFAGGRGTDHYYKTVRNNSGDSEKGAWYGNYTGLGQIYGDVELNITGGTFHDNGSTYFGNIYGGGLGFGDVKYNKQDATKKTLKDMARIYGTTTVNISGGTFEGNIYGGGAIANVGYGTSARENNTHYAIGDKNAVTLNISGGTIAGKVFGSAEGKTNVEVMEAPDSIGNIFGNVALNITGGTVGDEIYGGAEKGDVYGNVVASVNGAQIGGNIFGGGLGVLSGATVIASADVKGNTTVTLGSSAKYADDDVAEHFVYGGGNLASIIGVYKNSSDVLTTDIASVASVESGGNTTVNINSGMGTEQLTVYGAGLGVNTACNIANVTINNFATDRSYTVEENGEQVVKKKVIGLKEVFGGGNEGVVFNNTNVNMRGGLVLGEVFGGGNLAAVGTLMPTPAAYPYGTFGTTVSLNSNNAIVYGNIYGGGKKASVNGLAQVNMTLGQFGGEVYGGGKGEMTNANEVFARADINGQTRVFINGAKTIWNKLWDEGTKNFISWSGSLTDVNISEFVDTPTGTPKFKNPHNIFGGGYLACTVSDTARVEVTNGAVPANLIKLDVWKNSFRDNANPHFYVFGGGYGAFTQVKSTDVTVGVAGYFSDDEDESTNQQWALDLPFEGENRETVVGDSGEMGIYGNGYGIGGYTILGVIGGGYAGLVKDNTNVKLGGTTFVHRVYGGGYGHLASYNALNANTNITDGIAGYTEKDRDNLGEVGGNTRVLVSLSKPDEAGRTGGVYGDVFGGGAGVDPSPAGGGEYIDYVDMGKVLGTTRVDIVENARVYGNVYGGGDVANVANTASADSVTVVKVRGGDVFGSVFAGGKGRLAAQADNYDDLGNVFGNSYVIVRDSVAYETIDEEEVERTISPNVWGDIYGGGEVGNVNKAPNASGGNADVVIEGGNIGGNIFGAGFGNIDKDENKSYANIAGNTVVRVDGGSFLWDRIAGLDGNVKSLTDVDIDKETALAMVEARQKGEESPELTALKGNFADGFDLENNLFLIDHNIYGGGNTASVVTGDATITINHGLITDEVSYYSDNTWKLSTVLKQLVTGNNSHPQFSVLGGGYGINTTIRGNTLVNVQVGKDIDADGDTDNDDYPNQASDRETWTNLYNAFETEYAGLTPQIKDAYYGGTSGSNGIKRYETSRLANIFRVPNHTFMNIVGGGMAGTVNGNAEVNITDQSVCQNVFGGGIGIMPTSPNGNETYGQVLGNTAVNIDGAIVKGNVYGGGAGMESYNNNGEFIDFPEIGAVGKKTTVSIDGSPTGTVIFGKVFGGGDIADIKNGDNVEYATDVTIQGGAIYQQIFAGGSGRLDSEAKKYTNLGRVKGSTRVTVKDNPEGAANDPWIWNRIYGGGSYGSVDKTSNDLYGNTLVQIQGGHLGYNIFGAGLGDVRTLANGTESITTSYVAGNSQIDVTGGEWCLSQMWDIEKRNWVPKITDNVSAQFDLETKKFLINHNIYGGGNAASVVRGNATVNMQKGLLKGATALGHDDTGRTNTSLFASTEWREIYNKTGSFHFCVIGGGYGENTSVTGDTYVNVNLPATTQEISTDFIEQAGKPGVLKENMYQLFASEQSLIDVIGGGYNGKVEGDTHVTIEGAPFIRRIFGGSFYADVNNTNILIKSACADYIFGGGMMGDVKQTANVTIGQDAVANDKILLCGDVYGGNDVSGQVDGQITVNIKGGKIYNNVYGAGNGNYLYALNEERDKVAAVEGYEADGAVYDLVYEVPRRKILMPASAESSSEAARLVNINSYRPLSQYIDLFIKGTSTSHITVYGKVFGGGNTATVTKLDGNAPRVRVDIGNYVTAKEVFMGADGEAMFDESTSGFLNAFKRINNIELSDGINWAGDPYNSSIPQTYLPLDLDGRQRTFPHIIDLYFQPVEMSVQPILMWNGTEATHNSNPTITGTTIGSFFCGGNRGNMDVTPASDGSVVDYIFPAGLTITDKIVGGCNNANFTRTDLGVVHEGGYLLGKRKTAEPMIRLTVKATMTPTEANGKYSGANVYGGCYKSGSIHGDVKVDMFSNIIDGLDIAKLAASNADKDITVGSVYGAGYGTDSFVYGDINVTLGDGAVENSQATADALNLTFEESDNAQQSLDLPVEKKATATTYEDAGSSVNNLYGGGELGNVIGNTTVRVLNGHVVTDVVGGSYSGNLYGSTQVLIGYPQYYTVNDLRSGIYLLERADKYNRALRNYGNTPVVKDSIRLMAGDIVSPVVRDAIAAYDVAHGTSQSNNLTVNNPAPAAWSKIKITIGEAVYGGGYALSSGYSGTGGAGTYTVRKYDNTYNVDNSMSSDDPLYNKFTAGWGGNTTVLAWENDYSSTGPEHEHITISSESADGGFYGDGHLSYAEGYRSGELRGYGYANHSVLNKDKYEELKNEEGENVESNWKKTEENNAKVMNTIQRFDQMRLTDNCLILNGARDYTIREVSTTPYSIARVGELQMVSTNDTTVTTPFPTAKKARNYVGLMNNIHYVGAVKSDVDFYRTFHDYNGARDPEGVTYKKKKFDYIEEFYTAYPDGQKSTSEMSALPSDAQGIYNTAWNKFNLRNDATSLNMIGLSSGYALKIQGTQITDAVGTEALYYGPVDGVIEVKLIQPIADEGGGYVYADNVHEDVHKFLETTGNFVFPTSLGGGQKVVDDCLLTKFDKMAGKYGSQDKKVSVSEMHYWFLTGSHYFYNLHITGYTFNSEGYTDDQYVENDIKGIKFNADTSDGLTILEGATDNLVITGIKWKHHHKDDNSDDTAYNSACDIENTSKAYTLRLSASTTERDEATYTYYNQDEHYSLYYTIPRDGNLDNGDKKPELDGGEVNPEFNKISLSHNGDIDPSFKSPLLAIQLVDNVNNSGNNYYRDYLSKPDTLQIELRSKPEQWNTYTINLIINYVKGPTWSGNVTVRNCALPGEYIKVDKTTLTINSDESFAQNGEFLRIGKLNVEKNGFADDKYITYDASGKETDPLLEGQIYSEPTGKYLLIPAYYFMNGYGVQYVFTCNNMAGTEFPVSILPTNELVVHNYHQMKPIHAFPMDLHLNEAITRASVESGFPEPRIYIKNVKDLQAMQAWVDTVGVENAEHPEYNKVNYDGTERTIPQGGKFAQFFLQNDITVQQHTPLREDDYLKSIEKFAGTFHGDGHTITGIDGNLFNKLSAGNVYNLGLETGSIAGEVEDGGAVRNSYEHGKRKAYNIDGSATEYLEEEFNNGTVAYNLNQYYLEARKYILDEVKAGHATPTSADIANQTTVKYLKDYYANGDYQYARIHSEGDEYLRTNANPNYYKGIMNYDDYGTFHDTTHPVDEARKVGGSITNSLWTGLSEAESENAQMSLDTSLSDKVATDAAPATVKYKPLFNAAKNDDAASTTVVKNDYIFFGQGLQATPEERPTTIASHEVANMTNRVYRASGFYQSMVDKGFHFNASGTTNKINTYVHDARTTAIDFTGKRDEENASFIPNAGLLDKETQKIFYAPALDLPTEFYSLLMDEDVTKNLLVYTDDQTDVDNKVAKVAATTLNYNDDTDESDITGHHVIGTGTPITYTADRMHLVDMEDFNAPIQFTATKAWYVRDPSTETGYVNEAGKAWSSVSLPFTVETATLSDGIERHIDAYGNGDTGTQTNITYFYGSDEMAAIDKTHTILNHEFWLRNMTAVATSEGVTKATFKRPEYSIDGKTQNSVDANDSFRSFAAYKPFIVSFPGDQFYEFSMKGQTITFGATDAVVKVTDVAVVDSATTVSSYKHFGAYLNNSGKTGAYAIKVGDDGDKFVNGEAIYPFRSYITTSDTPLAGNSMDIDFNVQSSMFNADYILIGDDSSQKLEDVLDGDIERDPDGGITTEQGLRVYGVGQRIVVISDFATTLPVYTATGALVRVLDVRPGTATYSGFKQGIYVVDRKKIRLR